MVQQRFVVNKDVDLTLEDNGSTLIHVGGKFFRQCAYVLLQVVGSQNGNSIDEIIENAPQSAPSSLGKGPVVLYGHSLGKNQELLSLLTSFSVDTTIIADEETCACADVYRGAGIPLPACEPYKKYSRGKFLEKNHRWILLLSQNSRHDDRYHKLDRTDCRRAMFSGWVLDERWLREWRVDAGFPLSDHPSFPDVITFIEGCAPSTLLLMHGNGTIVRNKLLERRVDSAREYLARDIRILALK